LEPGELIHYSDRDEVSWSDSRQGQGVLSSQKCLFQLSGPTTLLLKGIWSCLEHKANHIKYNVSVKTQQFYYIKCYFRTTCFNSSWIIFRPSKEAIQGYQCLQCILGSETLTIDSIIVAKVHMSVDFKMHTVDYSLKIKTIKFIRLVVLFEDICIYI